MPRVKSGPSSRARHKRALKQTKGYKHGRKNIYRHAKQAIIKAKAHSKRSTKTKKRQRRSLWIVRINAACQASGVKYSHFIKALCRNKMDYNRKQLSDMLQEDPQAFDEILKKAMSDKVSTKSPK